ncbi:MAG TPA: hypothetical protein DCX95_03425 [Elusimicrobia bacterium]|nr:hypothetical protein [Elusimicrobiota bacterium]
MSQTQAIVRVFMQAFKSLPYQEKESFLGELVKNKRYREDLIDIAIIEARRSEPSRPFREYLAERRKRESK